MNHWGKGIFDCRKNTPHGGSLRDSEGVTGRKNHCEDIPRFFGGKGEKVTKREKKSF